MLRFKLTLNLLVLSLLIGLPISAFSQVNPFDEEEETEEEKPKKKKIKKIKKIKKKSSKDEDAKKKKAAAAKKKAAEEAAKKKAADDAKKKKEAEEAARKKAAEEDADEDDEEDEEDEDDDDEDDDEEDLEGDEEEGDDVEEEEDKEEVEAPPKKVEKGLSPIERVPLSANFNTIELITTGVVLAGGLTLTLAGTKLVGSPKASMRQPQLGSIDYNFSINHHGDLESGDPFLFGILDITAVGLPLGAGLYYLISGGYYWAADKTLLKSQSVNIDHSMIGYASAMGWTALTAGVTKLVVGRERPYSAFNRASFAPDDPAENNASFFSSTAGMGYAFAAFVGRDLSDWIIHRKMLKASPAKKFWLGRVVPTASLYSLVTLAAYSSIRNQKHYLSDVGMGALIGTLFGNLVYSSHFDTKGRPRIRHEQRVDVSSAPSLMATPDGKAVIGTTVRATW